MLYLLMDFSLLPTDHFLSLGKTKEPNTNQVND
nr:MAG TPA: hypothetical protein [Caudoviricetes sp.]